MDFDDLPFPQPMFRDWDFLYRDVDLDCRDLDHHDWDHGDFTLGRMDRVFILVGSTARFIPQVDEQIQGPQNVINAVIDPELSPIRIPLVYCSPCGVSWLVGEKAFIDGACPANGPAAFQASVGVYFGPESPNNISRLIDTDPPTNQLARITAAVEAMRQVRSVIVPKRCILLEKGWAAFRTFIQKDSRRFRLVLVTDSSYLVECMCKHMPQWTFDEANGVYSNRRSDIIRNSEGFAMLNKEMELLSLVGVQVQWYHVPRSLNREADALANAALRK
ncbi:hypothetical protein ACHAQJ_001392 [Trichoderma viride]